MFNAKDQRWIIVCVLWALSSTIINPSDRSIETKYSYLDIAKLGYEQYQDIFINGEVVQRANYNHNDCSVRYELLNTILSNYNRPFTMLDIGASQGYYSFRAAFSYPDSVFVMIEGNNKHYPLIGSQLLDLCKANSSLNNIIFLNKLLEIEDVRRLSECEHFDVVVALNIIHWFGDSWKNITDCILKMGSIIVIETPPQEPGLSHGDSLIRDGIEQYLLSKGARILGKVPRHTSNSIMSTIYVVESNKNYLERKTWLTPLLAEKTHMIIIDFNQKKLHKKVDYPANTYLISDWIPGINLVTFKMYSGAFPTADKLKSLLFTVRDEFHNDWLINNMVLQGNKLSLIDFNDPSHKPIDSGVRNISFEGNIFENHLKLMDVSDPAIVELVIKSGFR